MLKNGESAKSIAEKYNVKPCLIYGIKNGISWTHLTTKEDIEGITPENLVESYKNKIKRDCTATDEDFQIISQVYQSMSPDSPQLRKRF